MLTSYITSCTFQKGAPFWTPLYDQNQCVIQLAVQLAEQQILTNL